MLKAQEELEELQAQSQQISQGRTSNFFITLVQSGK